MLDSIYLKTKMNYQFKLALLSEAAALESCPLHVFITKREMSRVVTDSELKLTWGENGHFSATSAP